MQLPIITELFGSDANVNMGLTILVKKRRINGIPLQLSQAVGQKAVVNAVVIMINLHHIFTPTM